MSTLRCALRSALSHNFLGAPQGFNYFPQGLHECGVEALPDCHASQPLGITIHTGGPDKGSTGRAPGETGQEEALTLSSLEREQYGGTPMSLLREEKAQRGLLTISGHTANKWKNQEVKSL